MNERALAYVAAQLARFDLLSTDADAKGTEVVNKFETSWHRF
jgi:hypothetical protein